MKARYAITILGAVALILFWRYSVYRNSPEMRLKAALSLLPAHGMTLTHNEIAGPSYLKADASSLKETIVTPHLEQKIEPGKNVLWCSTFQLAWNELYDLGGGPVTLDPPSPDADILNKRTVTRSDLDDGSYVAAAGFGEDLVARVRRELKDKFHGQESPDLLDEYGEGGGLIAYAYLWKSLPFEWAFDRFSDRLEFQGAKVECFGIDQYMPEKNPAEAKMAEQVSVLDYRSQDDFIIELKTLRKDDRLILAKIPPLPTLQATIRSVQSRVTAATEPVGMQGSADLYVPVLDFDLTRSYDELTRRTIHAGNSQIDGAPLDVALQTIRFRLDEKGAVLKSEAMLYGCITPGNLVFDKPFLILIEREDAANPYFALWVGNTELLLPAGARYTVGRP